MANRIQKERCPGGKAEEGGDRIEQTVLDYRAKETVGRRIKIAVVLVLMAGIVGLALLSSTLQVVPPMGPRRTGIFADLANLSTALGAFDVDNGRYPTDREGLEALVVNPGGDISKYWNGPYLDKVPVDKWGSAYVYRFPAKSDPTSFDLHSVGPDHVDGTADDIDRFAKP